ncbi:hypothetical protein AB4Y90_16525 [Chryseobacterium sp. 2TAF14]|uniref:hypothetical protein n=1 Tax=Chryseobacterium sp. 2TAF14 TaxID=3233007 RepID=UPI003F8DA6CB
MNIIFTTINKKACTTELQKKLWDGAELMTQNQILRKLELAKSYLTDLTINITIDMAKGIYSVIRNELTDEQFFKIQRALAVKL